MDVFVVGSREPSRIMAEYARLTGKPEMPPLWSFGYLQLHRTLGGPEEVKWVARTFREKKLPFPLMRNIEVRLAGEKATRSITFDGRPAEIRF
ncbi:MAG TPA: hypothetical protein VFY40_22815 [Blastocatellia bacterium]|nr:hypothetical protein [Blastocatellia bacterium]